MGPLDNLESMAILITMTLREHAERLARAIDRAASEHGRPNGFGFAELESYGGPCAMQAGKAARAYPDVLESVGAMVNGSRIEVQ